MPATTHDFREDAAFAALSAGEWERALVAFEAELAARPGSAESLEGLGLAAWWLDRSDLVFEARERAFRAYRERGDSASAARLAVWLAWDHEAFRGEPAVASGWLRRARELLKGAEDSAEYAWLSVREAAFALLDDGDPDEARRHAEDAVRAGRAAGALDLEMVGRALRGFALVTSGQVAEGMRELDGVNAVVLAGELTDRVAIGLACCYLIAACDRVRDYDRAIQWCTRLREFCLRWGLRPLFAVCRTQYAAVCMWQGAWAEAERELVAATDELAASRPEMTSEGLVRLGELRRRQGRMDDAADLFDRAGSHPLAAAGLATLALDREDWTTANDLAERHLRNLPAHNRTERVAGLEVLLRTHVAREEFARADAVLAELQAIAEQAATAPLRASARLGAGVVAAGRGALDEARRHFEDAVDLFHRCGAAFERARAGLDLACTLERLGRPDAAVREAERAAEALAPMEAKHELARAEALLARLRPAGGARRPAGLDRLTPREVEVLRLISKGLSNQAIADRLRISEHTVHRHVANTLAKLRVSSRSAAVAQAARLDLL